MTKNSTNKSKIERHNRVTSILSFTNIDSPLSITEIWEQLRSSGFDIDRKTVERDISELSGRLKGLSETGSNPTRFYFEEGFKLDYSLSFTDDQLQIIIVALQNLKTMSSSVVKNMCIDAEDTLISKLPSQAKKEFQKLKVISSSGNTSLGESNDIDRDTFEVVLKSLRSGTVFSCFYQSPYKVDEQKEKRLFAPLKLNFVGGAPYLFIYDLKDMKIKSLRVSRIKNADYTEFKVNSGRAKEIKLDFAIGGYGTGDESEEIVEYTVYGNKQLALKFEEQRIHESQEILEIKDGLYRIKFKLNDSLEVVRMLAQYGEFVTKIEPDNIYEQVKDIWKKGLSVA